MFRSQVGSDTRAQVGSAAPPLDPLSAPLGRLSGRPVTSVLSGAPAALPIADAAATITHASIGYAPRTSALVASTYPVAGRSLVGSASHLGSVAIDITGTPLASRASVGAAANSAFSSGTGRAHVGAKK